MSAFFEANKDDYYKKLMNARLKNDFSDWIMFYLVYLNKGRFKQLVKQS
jgi:hypothetical protein